MELKVFIGPLGIPSPGHLDLPIQMTQARARTRRDTLSNPWTSLLPVKAFSPSRFEFWILIKASGATARLKEQARPRNTWPRRSSLVGHPAKPQIFGHWGAPSSGCGRKGTFSSTTTRSAPRTPCSRSTGSSGVFQTAWGGRDSTLKAIRPGMIIPHAAFVLQGEI